MINLKLSKITIVSLCIMLALFTWILINTLVDGATFTEAIPKICGAGIAVVVLAMYCSAYNKTKRKEEEEDVD